VQPPPPLPPSLPSPARPQTRRAASDGAARDSARGAAAPAPEFFALGDNPLLWDEDVLQQGEPRRPALLPLARDLTLPRQRSPWTRRTTRAAWRRRSCSRWLVRAARPFGVRLTRGSGSVAAHLGLRPIDALHLPLPVNVLLIGFGGDGEGNVTLSEEEVRRWVEGMDALLPHARRPPFPPAPPSSGPLFEGESYVSHNLSLHAVQCGRGVAAVFERAVALLARPEQPAAAEAASRNSTAPFHEQLWYSVDAGQVGALLASLARAVGLEAGHTLALLNLRRGGLPQRYGYRRGFSGAELESLAGEWDGMSMESLVRAGGGPAAGLSPSLYPFAAARPEAPRWKPPRPAAGFSWSHRSFEATSWAEQAMAALDRVALFRARLSPTQLLRAEAVAALQPEAGGGGGGDWGIGRELRWAIGRRAAPPPRAFAADCLTDTFVAPQRVAWADLSAGPLAWGPAGGGAGLRRGSLVASIFAGSDAEAAGAPDEAAMEAALEELAEERYERVAGEEAEDDAALLEMELDVYEAFGQRHCAGRGARPALCDELKARSARLERELASALDRRAAEEEEAREAAEGLGGAAPRPPRPRKPRPHGWSIFDGDPVEGARARLVRDRFLAELSQLLRGALRHAVVPTVTAGAFRAHATVRVTLYDVAWGGGGGRGASPHAEQLRLRLQHLLLPGQALELSVVPLSSADDAALAAALSAAARSGASGGGAGPAGSHRYLDAGELQRQLASLAAGGGGRGGLARGAAEASPVLHVPLFFITAASGPPLYLDAAGARTAASLGDMAVALASPHPAAAVAGGFACGREPLLTDLSDPLPGALAAMAAHLGGVRSAAHGPAADGTEDEWAWASGAHPAAATAGAGGAAAPAALADAVHRSAVVTALDASMEAANGGIEQLARVRTGGAEGEAAGAALWRAYRAAAGQAEEVLAGWEALVREWRASVEAAAQLDYGAAAAAAAAAEARAAVFARAAQRLAARLGPAHCAAAQGRAGLAGAAAAGEGALGWPGLQAALLVGLALGAVGALGRLALKPRRRAKPKLN